MWATPRHVMQGPFKAAARAGSRRSQSPYTPALLPLLFQPSLTMVDAFVGTWKLVDSKNFDDYMKSLGKGGSGCWAEDAGLKGAGREPGVEQGSSPG